MQPISKHIHVDAVDLRYLEYNQAETKISPNRSKPTVVFYHATGFVSELWEPVIRELGDDFHCIALDQRGHGGSDKTAPSYTWHDTASDFQNFLEAMLLKHVIAIGHSSGATSIAVTAARKPELIERAVLIEPTLRSRVAGAYSPERGQALIERTRSRRARWPSREAMRASLGQRPPYNSWTDEMLQLFVDHATVQNENGEVELLCTPEVEAQIYSSFSNFDPWPDLPNLRQPVLVVHGSGPSMFPTTPAAELMAVLPNAQLVELPEGGHLILMEAPLQVAAAIKEFLWESTAEQHGSV